MTLYFKKTGIISFFLFFLFSSSAFALFDPVIKIKVFSRYVLTQVEVQAPLARLQILKKGQWDSALTPPDLPFKILLQGKKLYLDMGSGKEADQIAIDPPRGSTVIVKLGEVQKKFSGKLLIRVHKKELEILEELRLEDYVRGVLEAEMPPSFPPEAIKAQAILIRTYALANLKRHQFEGYDLCDLTHCQVYGGKNFNYRSLDEAVQATRSMFLAYQLKPIEALYHSTCGGHTSPNQKVFEGQALPYLQGVDDEKWCSKSPHSTWESSISLSILSEVLKKDSAMNPKGEIQALKIADAEKDGRIFELEIEGKRNAKVSAMDFLSVVGRYLGWNILKSNWFSVELKNNEAVFLGHGLGHGVGFCQWGARGMAEAGKKYNEILFHYFPGTQLVQR